MTQLAHFFIASILSTVTWDLFLRDLVFPPDPDVLEDEKIPGVEIVALISKIGAQIMLYEIFSNFHVFN